VGGGLVHSASVKRFHSGTMPGRSRQVQAREREVWRERVRERGSERERVSEKEGGSERESERERERRNNRLTYNRP